MGTPTRRAANDTTVRSAVFERGYHLSRGDKAVRAGKPHTATASG
jgi:hypothetical protein